MTETRRRNVPESQENLASDVRKDEKSDEEGDDVLRLEADINASASVPQDTGKTTEVLDASLKDVSPRFSSSRSSVSMR